MSNALKNFEFHLPNKKGVKNVVLLATDQNHAKDKLAKRYPNQEAEYVGIVKVQFGPPTDNRARRPRRQYN